jgi:pilus assembly protein Flp/PilA
VFRGRLTSSSEKPSLVGKEQIFMNKIVANVISKLNADRGASAIEYALLISLIAVAVILGAVALGTAINGSFNNVSSSL